MGVRFCKGITKDSISIEANESFFHDANRIFLSSNIEYIRVFFRQTHFECLCYNDTHLDRYIKYCIALHSCKQALKTIKELYPVVTLVSFNELSLYLYDLFHSAGCRIICKGELWDIFICNRLSAFDVSGFIVCCEGNMGLTIEECGAFRNSFPDNEFSFLEEIYKSFLRKGLYNTLWLPRQQANNRLYNLVVSDTAFFAARLGNTESAICREYLEGRYSIKWLKWLYSTSGFFSFGSFNLADVDRFAQITLDAIKDCDVNLCRFENEVSLINRFSKKEAINLDWYDLYTDFSEDSWLTSLQGKNVLIVSSVNQTIKMQYNRRDVLFHDFVLPEMNLLYYCPPQTQFCNTTSGVSWFELLDAMVDEISSVDFDIAIIASGAYGYPLAFRIKRDLGKQAVELCSGIYPVFCIKIKAQTIIRRVSRLYNNNWIFPIEDYPNRYMEIENGAYWG